MVACLVDGRQPRKVQHATLDFLWQRVFGIACGRAAHPLALRERGPVVAGAHMAHVLADTVIATHQRRLKGRATRITIDLDPTDDPTHGQQEFPFFNSHYDTWCYLWWPL